MPFDRTLGAAAVIAEETPLACNLTALTLPQWTRHAALARKLSASVAERRELADGLSFRLTLGKITLAELGEWILMKKMLPVSWTFTCRSTESAAVSHSPGALV